MIKQHAQAGMLYIVPTPLGNLGDMVPRAIETLQSVDLIAAEDTRHSGRLMQHFQIATPMVAYHDYSETQQAIALIDKLNDGKNIALISDAGTPLISDPGYRLVRLAREHGITVSPIPGACALVAALSASGLPSDRFAFEGFLPAKTAARKKTLQSLARDTRTLIFYESPHRILDALEDLGATFGEQREIVLAREISKAFETFLSGTIGELYERVKEDGNQRKGEIVVVVQGFQEAVDPVAISPEAEHMMTVLLDEGLALKQAAAIVSRITSAKKNRLYDWGLKKR